MSFALSTRTQQVLEGVHLPADRRALEAYAERSGAAPDVMAAVRGLPDGRFGSLDDVGEAISPVQPLRLPGPWPAPHAHSGAPPGGDAYLDPSPCPAFVRLDPPEGGEGS